MENTLQSNISKETNQVWLQAVVSKQRQGYLVQCEPYSEKSQTLPALGFG